MEYILQELWRRLLELLTPLGLIKHAVQHFLQRIVFEFLSKVYHGIKDLFSQTPRFPSGPPKIPDDSTLICVNGKVTGTMKRRATYSGP